MAWQTRKAQKLTFADPAGTASFVGRFDVSDSTIPVQVVRFPASPREHENRRAILLLVKRRFVDVAEFLLAANDTEERW